MNQQKLIQALEALGNAVDIQGQLINLLFEIIQLDEAGQKAVCDFLDQRGAEAKAMECLNRILKK